MGKPRTTRSCRVACCCRAYSRSRFISPQQPTDRGSGGDSPTCCEPPVSNGRGLCCQVLPRLCDAVCFVCTLHAVLLDFGDPPLHLAKMSKYISESRACRAAGNSKPPVRPYNVALRQFNSQTSYGGNVPKYSAREKWRKFKPIFEKCGPQILCRQFMAGQARPGRQSRTCGSDSLRWTSLSHASDSTPTWCGPGQSCHVTATSLPRHRVILLHGVV